jgi:hypothetical protein
MGGANKVPTVQAATVGRGRPRRLELARTQADKTAANRDAAGRKDSNNSPAENPCRNLTLIIAKQLPRFHAI